MSKVQAKSTIGLRDLVLAPLTKDDATGVVYGELIQVGGAIEATSTPQNTDPNVQYADDNEYDVIYNDPEAQLSVELAALPASVAAAIGGHTMGEDGVVTEASSDNPPYYAVGFRSTKSNGKDVCIWFFKCRATPGTETWRTKEGNNTTRQTRTAVFTAIKRTYDNKYRAYGDEETEAFTSAATFLSQVYGGNTLPAVTGGGGGGGGGGGT